MGETPSDIRTGIARTRARIEETVDAIASTVDVPSRVKDTVSDAADNLRTRLRDGAKGLSQTVDDVSNRLPDGESVRITMSSPIVWGAAVLATGFVAGLAVPLSSVERRRLKPLGETLATRAAEARQEIVDQSTSVVRETVAAAQQSFQDHGRELLDNLGVATNGGTP